MKAVFAFDSFKGSASSASLADAASKAFLEVFPDAGTKCFPIADGGEGSIDAVCLSAGAEKVSKTVHDPLMRPIEACHAICRDGSALIEAAAASGLTLLSPSERNPMKTTSFGTGEQIAAAISSGCRDITLALGGTATNDAGIGILSALGYVFRDSEGNVLAPSCSPGNGNPEASGENLLRIASVDTSGAMPGLEQCRFTLACDVSTVFYGPDGAAYVFAEQKGASPGDITLLDKGLRHFSEIIYGTTGKDISRIPGSGAAGGICGGLLAFLNATIRPGIDMMLDLTGLRKAIAGADIVFTGEGSTDGQTLAGKAVSGICKAAKDSGTEAIVLCGNCRLTVGERRILGEQGATAVFPVQSGPVTLEEAMLKRTVLANISRTVKEIAMVIKSLQTQHRQR